MTFFEILGNALIGPLKLLFEIIFDLAGRFIDHPGLCIIVLSLVMNILVLPLYRRADAMQEAARDIDNKLRDGVAHIKKTFTGDERMMILQTYYRQNNYKPTQALNGSVSLLLEIPFFMAAYQFLSHLDILNGVSFGPIQDLGAPDGLITIGNLSINLLPILMTAVNVVSSALYLKGFPLKTKIQLYGMAGFFLVFLYTSPACLVFYWTLNNVFSLVKTIFYKLKNPQKVLRILTSLIGIGFLVLSVVYDTPHLKRTLFLAALGVVLQIPLLLPLIQSKLPARGARPAPRPNRKIFVLGCLFLTVLVGLLIPSAFVAASPQEYVDITYFHHPLWYVVSALSLSVGFFMVWMGVFYWLASPSGKVVFERLVWVLSGVTMVNYMFFGTDLGVISSTLKYDNGLAFTIGETFMNVAIVLAVAAMMVFVIVKWKKVASLVLATAIIAVTGMSGLNVATAAKSVNELSAQLNASTDRAPDFTLSKSDKNVVVIMLDRAMGTYVPYIFNEKPELKDKFDGFVHYSNTISFGGYTNFGTPSLLGGYEYTPVEMNKRDDEKLVDKHNEAHKVLPTVFSDAGYNVSLVDPVYTGYQWIPDLSVFDGIANTTAGIAKGKFDDPAYKQAVINNNRRNFFCFGLMKVLPLALQPTVYDEGQYNQVAEKTEKPVYGTQKTEGMSVATGLSANFMNPYNVLSSLSNMTKITEEGAGTYLFMSSDLTHEPMLLQEPDYVPAVNVDNTAYDAAHKDRFVLNGKELKVENANQMSHYQTNMATMIQLGKWFDYLREQGVYDNTRIILVADHGRDVKQATELVHTEGDMMKDLEMYQPLLMVKDFDAEGFTFSDDFMTNADVPTLALNGLVENAVNPFTGKEINNSEKFAHDQFIIMSTDWDVTNNNGNTYSASRWATVKENIWDLDNWNFYEEKVVLDEYKLP